MYHAGDGDCLLVTNDAGNRRLLVDGGRTGTFEDHALPDFDDEALATIDAVCVSHIDDDHISGILRLFDREVAWRRHLLRPERFREPRFPRPPRVKEIWHNALFQLVGDDLVIAAEHALATTSQLLRSQGRHDAALANENIALGERAGLELARRVSADQLDVEANRAADGGLLTRENAGRRRFQGMRVRVIGPSADDIDRLRVRWKQWIDDHPSAIDDLREELRDDEAGLLAAAGGPPIATDLGEGSSRITAPNLASIMLLLEEGDDDSVLLTGDGAADEILQGMEETGELSPLSPDADLRRLPNGQRRHVRILKLPHHGALANVSEELVHRISADHYVFCGNGAHTNPELEVVRRIAAVRRDGIGPDTPFKFWFSSSADTPGLTKKRRDHMQAVEDAVDGLIAIGGGQLSAEFMGTASFFDIVDG